MRQNCSYKGNNLTQWMIQEEVGDDTLPLGISWLVGSARITWRDWCGSSAYLLWIHCWDNLLLRAFCASISRFCWVLTVWETRHGQLQKRNPPLICCPTSRRIRFGPRPHEFHAAWSLCESDVIKIDLIIPLGRKLIWAFKPWLQT